MKRQPKPFSVEIKRTRRSQASSAAAPANAAAGERNGSDKSTLQKKRSSKPAPEAELVVPAFLQSGKPASRPSSTATAHDLERAFASNGKARGDAQHSSGEKDQSAGGAQPRILPSLTSGYGIATETERKPAWKTRGRKAAAGAATAKEARIDRRRKKESVVQAEHGLSIKARAVDESRQKPVPRQRADARAHSNATRKTARLAADDLAGHAGSAQRASRPSAPIGANETPRNGKGPRSTKLRRLLTTGRDDAAALPREERWKRRIAPRARCRDSLDAFPPARRPRSRPAPK